MPNTAASKIRVDPGLVHAAYIRYVRLLLLSLPIEHLRQLVAEIETELAGDKQ